MALDVDNFILDCFLNEFCFQLPISFYSEIDVHSASELLVSFVYIVSIRFVEQIVNHFAFDLCHPVKIIYTSNLVHITNIQSGHKDTPNWRSIVVSAR